MLSSFAHASFCRLRILLYWNRLRRDREAPKLYQCRRTIAHGLVVQVLFSASGCCRQSGIVCKTEGSMPYRPDRAALISLVAGGPDTSPMSPRRNQSLRKSFHFVTLVEAPGIWSDLQP